MRLQPPNLEGDAPEALPSSRITLRPDDPAGDPDGPLDEAILTAPGCSAHLEMLDDDEAVLILVAGGRQVILGIEADMTLTEDGAAIVPRLRVIVREDDTDESGRRPTGRTRTSRLR